ncbi:MAG: hypothetical protein ACSLFI_00605 [Solirubrobacterales bacterium]
MIKSTARLIMALALALAWFSAVTTTASASSLTIFKNSLKSSTGRAEISQYSGKANCDRGGGKTSFRTEVGKRTKECAYQVPMVGRDLGVSVTARLFKSTPKKVKPQAYLSVSLRHGTDGSRYQLSVFPHGRRYQLKKVFSDGKVQYLGKGKAGNRIGGFGEANRLTLRAYNDQASNPKGTASILAMVNGRKLASAADPRGNLLEGRDTTFSIGNKNGARGARGSFVKLSVRMPDPY